MTMTTEETIKKSRDEIIQEYRWAKNKVKQIGILADLYAVDKQTVVNFLIEAGESVPGNFLPRRRKEKVHPVELEPAKEAFELETDPNPPLLHRETTVAQLVAILSTIPGDAIIAEGFNKIRVSQDYDLSTGKVQTFVSLGCIS